jgi:hypothetical protein
MVNLLALLRFEDLDRSALPGAAAMLDYAQRVHDSGGHVVDHEGDQLLVCLTDMRWGLQSLRNLLVLARDGGFTVRAAIVQAVLVRPEPHRQGPAFTTRTFETLLRLAGQVDRQQVCITPKLLSLIRLSAPEFADLFDSSRAPAHASAGDGCAQPALVMAG